MEDGKGLSGKGRLTLARIDAIQNFYGRAIRDNKNNPEAMSRETWAIIDHYSSTPDQPRHDKCPVGEKSWCSFQRDIATGQSTHIPTKWPFPDAVVNTLKPLFSRLADVQFLEGCKECSTQNANESFNHSVWSLAPKEQFNSPLEKYAFIIVVSSIHLLGCLIRLSYHLIIACRSNGSLWTGNELVSQTTQLQRIEK